MSSSSTINGAPAGHTVLQTGRSLPAAFFAAAERHGESPFLGVKKLGVWTAISWSEAATAVRETAAGLVALGVRPAQRVAIVSHSRAECFIVELAILSVGAVAVALSPDHGVAIPALCRTIEATTVFVEGAELSSLWRTSPNANEPPPTLLIRIDAVPPGKQGSLDLTAVRARADVGTREEANNRLAETLSDSIAIGSFSAGTTAPPSVAWHSHSDVFAACRAVQARVPFTQEDTKLCFLSWARAAERLMSLYLPMLAGMRVDFAEGLDTVPENLREVSPTIVTATVGQLNTLRRSVDDALSEAGRLPQAAFRWAYACGEERMAEILAGRVPSGWLSLRWAIARRFVLANSRRYMGLDRCRHLIALEGSVPPGLARWYLYQGIPVVQVWGTTAALGVAAVNALPDWRFDATGRPVAHAAVSLEPGTGSLRIRDADSGHLGTIDSEGFIKLTGRAVERLRTQSGAEIPASRIQDRLRESALIRDALVFGDGRPFPSAIVLLSREAVERRMHRQGVPFADYQELARKSEVRELIQAEIDAVNAELDGAVQLRGFHILDVDLEPGGEEMTPTVRLRRWALEPRLRGHLEALYT